MHYDMEIFFLDSFIKDMDPGAGGFGGRSDTVPKPIFCSHVLKINRQESIGNTGS